MPTSDYDEIDLIAFLRTLWDFRYLIAAVTLLFGVVSVYLAVTATPKYRAEVVVAKVNNNGMSPASSLANQFGGLGRLAGFNLGQSGPSQEAQAVLESRHLSEAFIQRYELLDQLIPEEGEQKTLWRSVLHFRELVLTITEDQTEGSSTVAMTWTDPETAAKWANDYVGLANELIRTRALQQSQSNIEYLQEQVEKTNAVELERAIYNLLETEIQKLMIANARDEYAFTVVDPAVTPEIRVSPRRKVIVLSGGALGVLAGLLAVFAVVVFRQVRDRGAEAAS